MGAGYWFYNTIYENIKQAHVGGPALEYSIFPYSKNTRKAIRIAYQIGYSFFNYYEQTIIGKITQNLTYHKLSAALEYTQPWGTLKTNISAKNYLNDFRINRINCYSEISWRILEGLTLDIWGSFSLINDQISLAASTFDTETVLLQGRQLPTDFSYYTSIGLSYTFGSIHNSLVNPRMNELDD